MRIVVDLQGCQSSAHGLRGIGRYSMALVRAMARNCGDDELIVMLNGGALDSIGRIRAELADVLPSERVVVWNGIGDTRADRPENRLRRRAAKLVREDFLRSLRPDVVHVSSFFEGFIDDTITSMPSASEDYATAVTLYDLIPLVNEAIYLSDQRMHDWYFEQFEQLKQADLLLGISGHTCAEAMQYMRLPADRVKNISAAVDRVFAPAAKDAPEADALRDRLGLATKYVMYTGGIDPRKNVDALIEAYAGLPAAIRADRQLVIVCSVAPEQREHLLGVAAAAGLGEGELVLTGYVKLSDLVWLYRLCELFVFPSWDEGFGLPVLEAMACGAPVIGSDASSIPEVIGRSDALFDPRDVAAITAKLEQVLQDAPFRAELAEHGLRRSQAFSWDHCAREALDAMRSLHRKHASNTAPSAAASRESLPRLAFVSPVPPERSGISDYSAELLPVLAQHYQIDVISDQQDVSDPWISQHLAVRSVEWFRTYADRYDRVIYQFGNSMFHEHMFELLQRIPGTVVLHDFYLSGIISHLEWVGKIPRFWSKALYEGHGYKALIAREEIEEAHLLHEEYPCNAPVLEQADGIVVHSRFAARLAEDWYGVGTSRDWSIIPHLRALPQITEERHAIRARLGIGSDETLICCFGIVAPLKLNHVILEAWLSMPPELVQTCRLVFVGASNEPTYDAKLMGLLGARANDHRVTITGYVDKEVYKDYLAAADIAVQLRHGSHGETSGTVLDCMAYALPVVVNAHGSMAELPPEAVLQLPDQVTAPLLRDALIGLVGDADRRKALGARAQAHCKDQLEPNRIAAWYRDAIEQHHVQSPRQRLRRMARALAGSEDMPGHLPEIDLRRLAVGVASNQKRKLRTRQLLVDVSELVRRDAKSGIQRVVRNIMMHLLLSPPEGYRVEPVYSEPGSRYRYARRFTTGFLGLESDALDDDVIDFEDGDGFLGIDLAPQEVAANADQYRVMRASGVAVYFVVYDLLPLALSESFPSHAYELFSRWIETVASVGDGAVCISRAVAEEVLHHLDAIRPQRHDRFDIGYFHLGADIDARISSAGVTGEEALALSHLSGKRVLLMVGTIEPRKGHAQALDAFDELRMQHDDIAFVVVGKPGWMTEALAERMRLHRDLDSHLFWFERATDELLARIYALADVLLVPSKGEGFGLPLIEAAQHDVPIICRDLPVFREVAGEGATYFTGDTGKDLAAAVERWMAIEPGERPSSASISPITWRQSCDQLLEVIVGGRWMAHWDRRRGHRFPAYDRKVKVEAGRREMGTIATDGQAGMLMSCEAAGIRAGAYRFSVVGDGKALRGKPTFELFENGESVLEGELGAARGGLSNLTDVIVELSGGDSVFSACIWVGADDHLRIDACLLEPLES